MVMLWRSFGFDSTLTGKGWGKSGGRAGEVGRAEYRSAEPMPEWHSGAMDERRGGKSDLPRKEERKNGKSDLTRKEERKTASRI